jgi:hypothetical protein
LEAEEINAALGQHCRTARLDAALAAAPSSGGANSTGNNYQFEAMPSGRTGWFRSP